MNGAENTTQKVLAPFFGKTRVRCNFSLRLTLIAHIECPSLGALDQPLCRNLVMQFCSLCCRTWERPLIQLNLRLTSNRPLYLHTSLQHLLPQTHVRTSITTKPCLGICRLFVMHTMSLRGFSSCRSSVTSSIRTISGKTESP
jgi:hypothetical protein